MTTRLTVSLALILAVLLAAPPAHAQSPLAADTWTVTPLIGIALDPDSAASLVLTGAAAFPLTNWLAIEGELGHVFDMAAGDSNLDVSLTTVHASLLAFFETDFVMTPYVAGGFGLGKFSRQVIGPPADFETTEVGFNLGGGVTYRASDAVWLRGDFRWLKHIDNVPYALRFVGGVTIRIGN